MTCENELFVQSLLDDGVFHDRDAVIEAAIERWRLPSDEFAAPRAKVQIGIDELDRGEGEPLEVGAIVNTQRRKMTVHHGH